MKDTVYDAELIGRANKYISKNPSDNLVRRLTVIRECVTGSRRALYNNTLTVEYTKLTKECRNDVIDMFVRRLTDNGKPCGNTLTRQDYARANDIGWPPHDRHLLAAAREGAETTIYVIEPRLSNCARKALRIFRFHVIKV